MVIKMEVVEVIRHVAQRSHVLVKFN